MSMTKPTAEQITYLAPYANAVQRTVQERLGDTVNVHDFGAKGDGVTDDTAAIHAAIDSLPSIGGRVLFPTAGRYRCNILVLKNNVTLEGVLAAGGTNTASGREAGLIPADLTKPVLQVGNDTGTVAGFQAINLYLWRGAGGAYGLRLHGGVRSARFVNFSAFTNVRSIWIEGGVLPITYVHFVNFRASGQLYVRAAAAFFCNGQIIGPTTDYALNMSGDLSLANCWIQAYPGFGIFYDRPSGAYKGKLRAANVIVDSGDSTQPLIETNDVDEHNKIISNYLSGTITLDGLFKFADGTTVSLTGGRTGWASNPVISAIRHVGALSLATTGDPNATGATVARVGNNVVVTAPDDVSIVATGALRPETDNNITCGTASRRWSDVYSASPTINTSDAREKQDVRELADAERAVAVRLKGLVKAFRMTDAVAKKGDGARIHVGIVAQDVRDAFIAEGLDPSMYGLFCHDAWDAAPAELDDEGNVVSPALEAGDRYGVRYEELLAFIVAAL